MSRAESKVLGGHILEADSCPWNQILQEFILLKRLCKNT